MEYAIVGVAALTLAIIVNMSFSKEIAGRVLPVLLAAFVIRLTIHALVMRNGGLWYGGDNFYYEARAIEIVEEWKRSGFHFVAAEDSIKSVAVPCNVFAIVIYLCEGKAPLACTAIVALIACALCIVIYRFSRLLGADDRSAFRLLVITAFTPAFLVHTSDTFKDGFNAFLVVACLGLACSNMQRLDMRKLFVLGPLLLALWHVRPYMVFMCAPSIILGIVGGKRALPLRVMAICSAVLVCILAFLGEAVGSGPVSMMQEQLEYGQADSVRHVMAGQDSGVEFEDGGSAWSALGPKLLYTLFSPFPWTGGSPMLQLGKVEVLLWYFLLYSAVQGARKLWRYDHRMLWVLLLFIVPSMIAYATTMANIGLIFRQRMPIVMITSLLAAVAWTRFPREEPSLTPAPGAPHPGSMQPSSSREP